MCIATGATPGHICHPNLEVSLCELLYMDDPLSKDQITEWLDQTIVHRIEEIDDPEPRYNLSLNASQYPIHLVRESEDDILRVLAQCNFDPELLANIFARGHYKRNFRTQMTSVITNTPGVYQFLDADGNETSYEGLRLVRFEDHIYADGASRQRVMDSVMALSTAALYVKQITDNFAEELVDNR